MAEPWRPSGSLPADVFTSPGASRLRIVTGPFGCGKTTWCLALLAQAQLAGIDLYGVICPAVFEDGEKTAIDAIFLGGGFHGKRTRLAELSGEKRTFDPSTLKLAWDFDPEVMRLIDEHFALLKTPENLVIDEIGPLEFIGGAGWQSAISVLDKGLYRRAFVVVRPSLLSAALERWPSAEVIEIGSEKDAASSAERKYVATG